MVFRPAVTSRDLSRSRRQRRWRHALLALAAASAVAWSVYLWQPLRYDWIARTPPRPNPWTNPDTHRLFAPGTRVAIVTAHPDDSEFYLAGLLMRLARAGAKLSLVIVTDGDKGYYPFADACALRVTRRREQDEAARRWKAQEVVYMGHRDGRLQHTPALIEEITAELRRLRPEYVLVLDAEYPPRLTHRDHRRAGVAGAEAARQTPSARWLLHFSTLSPNWALDVTEGWEARWTLLKLHRSQFRNGPKLQRVQALITGNAERDGRLLKVRYAEGCRCIRLR